SCDKRGFCTANRSSAALGRTLLARCSISLPLRSGSSRVRSSTPECPHRDVRCPLFRRRENDVPSLAHRLATTGRSDEPADLAKVTTNSTVALLRQIGRLLIEPIERGGYARGVRAAARVHQTGATLPRGRKPFHIRCVQIAPWATLMQGVRRLPP